VLGVENVKPLIPVTLLSADTTPKAHLAASAISKSLEQADFTSVKLLTNQPNLPYAVEIPELNGLEAYSKFCVQDMTRYVETDHALVIQADGFLLNGAAWTDEFLKYDWIGAPYNPTRVVGNGGFSLRSKRLLDFTAKGNWEDAHPEDSAISIRHRAEIIAAGMKIAPLEVARKFAIEGRSWAGTEWQGIPNEYTSELGFHSLLTKLPADKKPCKVFHHSLDQGDLVYGMAAIKALGGGMVFISPDNRYPFPLNSRWARVGASVDVVNNLKPLIMAQDYIWGCSFTQALPFSTDYDLNKFRMPWRERTPSDFTSILQLHMDAFNLPMPTGPWLTVKDPIKVPGKPFVVNRTQRYHNYDFPWDRFVNKWHDKIVFVGSALEAELFQGFAPDKKIQYYPTKDVLELARVIAGAERFVGNQSLALAIAHGLNKPVAVEQWPGNPNCKLIRPNAIYGLPSNWLE